MTELFTHPEQNSSQAFKCVLCLCFYLLDFLLIKNRIAIFHVLCASNYELEDEHEVTRKFDPKCFLLIDILIQ